MNNEIYDGYSDILIIGPRISGKSTFIKKFLQGYPNQPIEVSEVQSIVYSSIGSSVYESSDKSKYNYIMVMTSISEETLQEIQETFPQFNKYTIESLQNMSNTNRYGVLLLNIKTNNISYLTN